MDPSTAQGPGSAPIYRVPIEVWHRIFSYLAKPWGSPENLSILLLSKKLYHVALPLTVNRFENPIGLKYDDNSGLEAQFARFKRRNARFLRLMLIQKPELSPYVQSLCMRSLTVDNQQPFAEHSERDLEFYADWLVNNLNLAIPFDSAVECIDSLGKGCADAHFAFLIAHLPGLAAVSYNPAYVEQDADAKRALELAESPGTTAIRRFHNTLLPLRSIDFSAYGRSPLEIWHFRPDRFLPAMFTKPFLESILRTHVTGDDSLALGFEELPPRASPVKHIYLFQSKATHRMLQALLNSCESVVSFTLEGGRDSADVKIGPEVRPRDMIESLLPHKRTLRRLVTTFDAHQSLSPPEIMAGKSFFGRQLADMTALTRLTADMESITGVSFRQMKSWSKVVQEPKWMALPDNTPSVAQCLPASLKYLEVRNCTFVFAELMQEFLQQIGPGKLCPKLKHVRLLFNYTNLRDKDHLHLWMDATLPLRLDLEYMPESLL
ncbi:unnamed protein product [Clonostachys rosea]|uniref:F-box domain-containing protein n=1 Tax=Bionectria ochroleuca TaxID=29856 RepID=A0ABY6V3I3_BIOOC|nr:unnamed protein product [Clonostachys rosea]